VRSPEVPAFAEEEEGFAGCCGVEVDLVDLRWGVWPGLSLWGVGRVGAHVWALGRRGSWLEPSLFVSMRLVYNPN